MKETTFWQQLKSGEFASMVKESSKGKTLSFPDEAYHIFKPLFAKDDDVEQVFCIFMDNKNYILKIKKMFSGSICSSMIYPRELIKQTLQLKASSVIMAHNHPSGSIQPSTEDHKITAKVTIALKTIDVVLADHMIIGNSYYSFCDQGWIAKANQKYNQFLSTLFF